MVLTNLLVMVRLRADVRTLLNKYVDERACGFIKLYYKVPTSDEKWIFFLSEFILIDSGCRER